MKINTRREVVNLSALDWQDQRFCTSFFPDLTGLKRSVQTIGLVTPPLVKKTGDGRFQIISGWRRLFVLREMRQNQFEAAVAADNIPDTDLLQLVLYENMSLRNFNFFDKAMIIANLEKRFQLDENQIVKQYLPILNLGNNPRWLNLAREISQFPAAVQEAFSRESLSSELIGFLSGLTDEEKIQLTQTVTLLHLGKNRQKELSFLLSDLLRMRNLSFPELMAQDSLRQILQDEKLTYSQKTTKFFTELKQQRFPVYTKTLRNIQNFIRSLKLPHNAELQHSPFFESEWFTFQFRFRNQAEFGNVVKTLQRLNKENKISRLIDLIENDIPDSKKNAQ
ncbi:MAG TPA: hypothetical protein ENH29_00900 [Bacteroidetes bacterium]|nr:hypothetical protein [Bacteroidota bacterium]